MMASGSRLPAPGSRPLTAERTSSSEETMAVSNPACSSAAFTRTACSRSSVVMRTRSAMDVCDVRRVACGVCRVIAGDEVDGMIEELLEHRQSLFHTIRRAGEIDDQGFAPRARAAARQPGTGKAGPGRGPQRFGDSLGLTLQDRRSGFRCDVALGEASTAGREYDI